MWTLLRKPAFLPLFFIILIVSLVWNQLPTEEYSLLYTLIWEICNCKIIGWRTELDFCLYWKISGKKWQWQRFILLKITTLCHYFKILTSNLLFFCFHTIVWFFGHFSYNCMNVFFSFPTIVCLFQLRKAPQLLPVFQSSSYLCVPCMSMYVHMHSSMSLTLTFSCIE